MKRLLSITLITGIILGLNSCDYVKQPFENIIVSALDTTNTFNDNDSIPIQRILVEEFTGHTCGNCPEAAYILDSLKKNIYKEQMILVSIHAGFFAEPYTSGTKYLTDFRTASGDTYFNDFNVQGTPKAMINRNRSIINNGNYAFTSPSQWNTVLNALKDSTPSAQILLSFMYDESSRNLSTSVKIPILKNLNGSYALVLYFIEDNIVDWQKIYPNKPVPGYGTGDIEFYTHKHVLRGTINGTWGETVITSAATIGDTLTKNYSAFNVKTDWNIDNGYIVAYLYNTATKEILQAREKKIKP
ncbi:MAG: Omp28 family outer membrane lipoprotein [Bacteroidia bacterium]